jgi:hypothetical protein
MMSVLSKFEESRLKSGFSQLRDLLSTKKHEKNILKAFLSDSEKLKYSLTSFYRTITHYLNEVFPELTYANILFVDVASMKVIRWHTASNEGAEVYIRNDKVTRLYEKIIDRQ